MEQPAGSDPPNELPSKVRDWLLSEGYPLEFRAANIMRSKGFRVSQGQYVRSADSETAREIDVVGWIGDAVGTTLASESFTRIRVLQVIECKWSKDKPWVIFVSPESRVGENVCVAQTISSEGGKAVMRAIADEPVRGMKLFSSPPEPGFNGREAFSKNDRFYNSMRSVTELTSMLVREFDQPPTKKERVPRNCVVAFPTILVEGQLFEAYFCDEDNTTKIREAQQIRCHWSGSTTGIKFVTIDVVTLAAFDEFCATRFAEARQLLKRIVQEIEQIKAEWRRQQSL